MKKYDVSSICNALVDFLVEANDSDVEALKLNKGVMHLVDDAAQQSVMDHFKNSDKTSELGGSSMNSIRTLAALGANTFFAGMIGKDELGKRVQSRLDDLKINSTLVENADFATGTCFVIITPDGERTMNTNLGASCHYDLSIVNEQAVKDSKIFHFCGYQWATDNQKAAIMKAIEVAEDNDGLVSFDVADPFVVNLNKDEFADIIAEHADVVFANQEEAKLLYGLSPEETAKKIMDTGAIAVVKLGAEGALVGKGGDLIRIKPVKTEVVDTTGAGDMFASGFLFGLSQGKSLEECGNIAAAVASDVISRIGATVSSETIAKFKK
jgi:sugar/nucleoside kinase (ribokinase family)